MDIHRYEKIVGKVVEKIRKDKVIPSEERELLLKYYKELLAKGLSYGRIMKYLQTVRKIYHLLRKSFLRASKEDFIQLVTKIERNSRWTEWTKHDFKVVLRRYYRWLRGLSDKDPFPEEVRWISINIRNASNKLPKDILNEEEIQKLVRAAKNPRDRAFILALYESGCRIGEFLRVKIKDLEFDENGCILYVTGKTGDRRIRLVASTLALQEWLENHPQKNKPNAYLWIQLPSLYKPSKNVKPLSYGFVCRMLRDLAREVGITKPVNPHAFRHARATHLANFLTEAQLNEFFGWIRGSKMASVYVKLSGRDTDKAILSIYGIEPKQKKKNLIAPISCFKCKEINPPSNRFCKKFSSNLLYSQGTFPLAQA